MIFVDTNYFLRFLLKDSQSQFIKAKKLFQDAAGGKTKLFTSTVVIFEIYWVLSSFYQKKKEIIYKNLHDLISLEIIKLTEKEIILSALKIFKNSSFDLEDSYNLIYAQENNADNFATFDKKLEKKFNSS